MGKVWDIKPPQPKWSGADYAIARWVQGLQSRGQIINGVAVLIVYNPRKPSASTIVKDTI